MAGKAIQMASTGFDSSVLSTQELMQPEVMDLNTIQQILLDRGASINRNWSKEDLIDLYKRLVLPMPQNDYENSYHCGRHLNARRKAIAKSTSPQKMDIDHRRQPSKRRHDPDDPTTPNHRDAKRPRESLNIIVNCASSSISTERQEIKWP